MYRTDDGISPTGEDSYGTGDDGPADGLRGAGWRDRKPGDVMRAVPDPPPLAPLWALVVLFLVSTALAVTCVVALLSQTTPEPAPYAPQGLIPCGMLTVESH